MFTGIIEEIGLLRRAHRQGQAMVLTIGAQRVLEDVKLGDSIAVNGVCLTVIAFDASTVAMDVMPETYRHTNLGMLSTGSRINLERAIAANGRFGGHLVQGHVDTTGTIVSRTPEENAVVFTVQPRDPEMLKYVVERGSITIDGISLTVIRVTVDTFTVSIIPHTLAQTILQEKQPGGVVNLESDIMGKYLEKLLRARDSGISGRPGMSAGWLADHGFI